MVTRNIVSSGKALRSLSNGMSDEMRLCLKSCIECHQVCEQMVRHCLQMGGLHADPIHIRLLQDCSQICEVTADFMIRESGLYARACGVCAEVCRSCADDCELMPDDKVMEMCAEVCRRCAESCDKAVTHH